MSPKAAACLGLLLLSLLVAGGSEAEKKTKKGRTKLRTLVEELQGQMTQLQDKVTQLQDNMTQGHERKGGLIFVIVYRNLPTEDGVAQLVELRIRDPKIGGSNITVKCSL